VVQAPVGGLGPGPDRGRPPGPAGGQGLAGGPPRALVVPGGLDQQPACVGCCRLLAALRAVGPAVLVIAAGHRRLSPVGVRGSGRIGRLAGWSSRHTLVVMTRPVRLLIVLGLNVALIAGLVAVGIAGHSVGLLAAGGDYLADSGAIAPRYERVFRGSSEAGPACTSRSSIPISSGCSAASSPVSVISTQQRFCAVRRYICALKEDSESTQAAVDRDSDGPRRRSGKSAHAEQLAAQANGQVIYVATGGHRPGDPEWAMRVAAHQARRPASWRTSKHPISPARIGNMINKAARISLTPLAGSRPASTTSPSTQRRRSSPELVSAPRPGVSSAA
jgi:hypothetical protein